MDVQERSWRTTARRLVLAVAGRFDAARARVGARGTPRRVIIDAYRGYGNDRELLVRGRVLRDRGVRRAEPGDRWWSNLVQAYRRLESDEVAGARVEARYGSTTVVIDANDEGHFEARLPLAEPPPASRWLSVALRLIESDSPVEARAPVYVPSQGARYGVISDMDDTVIRTDVHSLWRMLRLTLFANAHTRVAFPGVSAFFRALHGGAEPGGTTNPLFFVSSSPWNLHDLLEHFLELNDIPQAPLVLRDWGTRERELLQMRHRGHKLEAIREIMEAYPDLPFILIGDSGQQDPEIYRDVVHDFPKRVLAAYIRDVSPDPLRKESIRALTAEVRKAGSALVLADDTLAAARHAAEHGWIPHSALPAIEGRAGTDRARARADGIEPKHGRTVVVETDRG